MRRNVDEKIVRQRIETRRGYQKKYFDRGTKKLENFRPGDKIMFKKNEKEWKYGIVKKLLSDRSYIVTDGDNQCFRRNRVMMKRSKNEDKW